MGETPQKCNLQKICFPRGLDAEEMKSFEESAHKTVKVTRKQKLYQRTQPLTSLYAIKAGSIKTSFSSTQGQTQVLGFHMAGDLLGLDGFATDRHTSDAVAMEDSLLLELPIENFESLCQIMPSLRKIMMQQVGSEINRSQALALTLGQMQTDERLATYILRMSCYFKSRGFSSTEFNLPMPRNDLANYLGMAPETLSRTIAKMEKQSILKFNRREITIFSIEGLINMAHDICVAAE
ncbi:MAG: Crp/Fnr family transcriptional regulator [uncultured Thiotrichaceae bacterium]|uniref:Crp/Fnr family transcriptional regulator n=1 Tax=uncultured Thiotrichaceae bacterium TaxID=298394 RepID=A0A6S6TE37_9GAMM|nr:MAG: Crp/Fnr family transcriptional regulator [uncultured Thiotrichaceae bacterium]